MGPEIPEQISVLLKWSTIYYKTKNFNTSPTINIYAAILKLTFYFIGGGGSSTTL